MDRDMRSAQVGTSTSTDFEVDTANQDGLTDQPVTTFEYTDFPQWQNYYETTAEAKKPIQTYATWVVGQGYTTQTAKDEATLNNIRGWGEDDITSILWNMLVVKKFNGDSFAKIVRNDKGTLINILPLTPSRMKTDVRSSGTIKQYRYLSPDRNSVEQTFKPEEIFHLCNDRILDNGKGDSVIETLKWYIDAKWEAMKDVRRVSHNSSIRIIYVDEDNIGKITDLETKWAKGIATGNVMLMPGKKGVDYEVEDITVPALDAWMLWIKYLENSIYKAVGVPKTLAGDAEGIPESGGKMVVFTHQPTYIREVTVLENDFKRQIGIEIKFNRQEDLSNDVQETDSKNTNQTQATQPGDTNAGTV